VQLFPWALLIGQRFYGEPEKQVRASAGGRFIRSYGEESGWVRWWGGSRTPHAVVVALREQTLLQGMMQGTLSGGEHLGEITPRLAEFASSRIFGAFEYRIEIAPGARESLRLAVVFHKDGDDHSKPVLEQLLVDPDVLAATERYFAEKLGDARLFTPSAAINRGVAWAKVNMLRVVKEYPQGWGSTNSPPSDILVSRDTSWFVHGYDYFLPQFSRDAIELFNRFLEPSGQVVEYVRGVNGYRTAYDLNVNDDTPLHIIAILHHYNATLDDEWLRAVYPLVVKIADYMLTQRDANGLIFCKAGGVDMFGITSWRNIIPYYTLDGAVTEINAEAYFALEATARLAAVLDDGEAWERFSREASALREAILAKLFNADTSAFVLNYDKDNNPVLTPQGTSEGRVLSPTIPGYVVAKAGHDVIREAGVSAIREHNVRLTTKIADLAQERGLIINTPLQPEHRTGWIGIDFNGCERGYKRLIQERCFVDFRPGCGIRGSPHFYTDDDDINRFFETLDRIRKE